MQADRAASTELQPSTSKLTGGFNDPGGTTDLVPYDGEYRKRVISLFKRNMKINHDIALVKFSEILNIDFIKNAAVCGKGVIYQNHRREIFFRKFHLIKMTFAS